MILSVKLYALPFCKWHLLTTYFDYGGVDSYTSIWRMQRMAVAVSKLQIPCNVFTAILQGLPHLNFPKGDHEDHTLKSTELVLKIQAFDGMVKQFDQPSFAKNTFFKGLLKERGWFRIPFDNSPFCHLVIRHHSLPDASKHEFSAHPCRSDFCHSVTSRFMWKPQFSTIGPSWATKKHITNQTQRI